MMFNSDRQRKAAFANMCLGGNKFSVFDRFQSKSHFVDERNNLLYKINNRREDYSGEELSKMIKKVNELNFKIRGRDERSVYEEGHGSVRRIVDSAVDVLHNPEPKHEHVVIVEQDAFSNKFDKQLSVANSPLDKARPVKELKEEQRALIYKLNNPSISEPQDPSAIVKRLDRLDFIIQEKENKMSSDGRGVADGFVNAVVGLWPGSQVSEEREVIVAPSGELVEVVVERSNRSIGSSFADAIVNLWP